jgi:ParB family chromosome partitioning protein
MITNIDIKNLEPHPNNPRLDIGDITELAESIKINGVMQNLTVVDNKDYEEEGIYTVIIGHRRLEAAKLAGLTELPCAIVEMTQQEQVATMLLENMQRSDLTAYEQAQGFQMMFDFGESVDSISNKTGFSESTVRRRIKLLELDQEKLYKSVENGATLMDFAELEKIDDINIRNEVLNKFGTHNFKWELERAIEKQRMDKKRAEILRELKKFAKPTDEIDYQKMAYVCGYSGHKEDKVIIPDDSKTTEYYYMISDYGTISLHKKREQVNESEIYDEEKEKLAIRKEELYKISEIAYESRLEFVKNFKHAKEHMNDILEYIVKFFKEYSWRFNDSAYEYILKAKKQKDCNEKILLALAYCKLDDRQEVYFIRSDCKYYANAQLDEVYDLLFKLGYQMSDEELSLRAGTHELFKNEAKE